MQVQGKSWLHTRSTFVATLLALAMTIGIAVLSTIIFDIIVHLL
jgi:hypothetical protein